MIISIVRFFQRYAMIFSVMAGVISPRPFLPKDSPWWLELPIFAGVMLAVHWLLYKEGVTGVRAGGKPGLSTLAIVGWSVNYWFLLAVVLFIMTAGECESATAGPPFDRCINWQNIVLIISTMIAAVVYALGLRAAIRKRRRHSFLD